MRGEDGTQPFLYDRLAVAAGNGYNFVVEAHAMGCRQGLQCPYAVGYPQYVAVLDYPGAQGFRRFDYKLPQASAEEIADERMAVVIGAPDGKKDGVVAQDWLPTVGDDMPDFRIGVLGDHFAPGNRLQLGEQKHGLQLSPEINQYPAIYRPAPGLWPVSELGIEANGSG